MKHVRCQLQDYWGHLLGETDAYIDDEMKEEYISLSEQTHRREYFQHTLDGLRADSIGLENLVDRLNGMKK